MDWDMDGVFRSCYTACCLCHLASSLFVLKGEEASRAMETVQAKAKQPEDPLLWRLHLPGV